jgi:hypothetical protein
LENGIAERDRVIVDVLDYYLLELLQSFHLLIEP